MGTATAIALVLAILLADALWVAADSRQAQLLTGPAVAGLLLLVGRWAGLSWTQLGLAGALPVWSAGLVAAVAAGYAGALRLPLGRRALRDPRYRHSRRRALRLAAVDVPLATVLPEEVAFRGVLWGLLAVRHGPTVATVATATLFGVWHVLSALDAARPGRALPTVLGTVAATAAAGLLLGALRQVTGSLAAPVALHWAANGLGVLAAARAWAGEPDDAGTPGGPT